MAAFFFWTSASPNLPALWPSPKGPALLPPRAKENEFCRDSDQNGKCGKRPLCYNKIRRNALIFWRRKCFVVKSGWQKSLKVVSILLLIDAVASLALVALTLTGTVTVPGIAPGGPALWVAATLLIVGGVFDLLCGMFGLKAAGDGAKAKPAVVLGVLSVVVAASNLVLAFSVQYALGCVIPVLYLVSALQVKQGK